MKRSSFLSALKKMIGLDEKHPEPASEIESTESSAISDFQNLATFHNIQCCTVHALVTGEMYLMYSSRLTGLTKKITVPVNSIFLVTYMKQRGCIPEMAWQCSLS